MRSLLSTGILAAFVLAPAFLGNAAHADNDDSFCPVSGVNPQTWTSKETGEGTDTDFTWFLHPCGSGGHAKHEKGCTNFGMGGTYFAYWNPKGDGGDCQTAFHTWESKWKLVRDEEFSDALAYRTTYLTMEPSNVAHITIICDANATNLEPSGKVETTYYQNPGGYPYVHYHVKLKSNAVCTPLPPTPMPTTECTHHSSCYGCIMASSGTCGYCKTTDKCLQGTSRGPGDGQVCTGDNWKWYADNGDACRHNGNTTRLQ